MLAMAEGCERGEREDVERGIEAAKGYENVSEPIQAESDTADPLFWAFVLLGISCTLTFSLLLMAVDFLNLIFPGRNVEYHFAALYKLTNLAMGVVVYASSALLPPTWRVCMALSVQAAVVLSVIAMPHHEMLFAGVFALGGAAQAFSHGTLFAICATAPERCFRALMIGIGGAGILASLLKMGTKSMVSEPFHCCRLWALELFALYVAALYVFVHVVWGHPLLARLKGVPRPARSGEHQALLGGGSGGPPVVVESNSFTKLKETASATKGWLLLLVANWTVSYAIFPGLTSEIESFSDAFEASGWFHILIYFGFLFADVCGRFLTSTTWAQTMTLKRMAWFSAARLLFIPGFLLITLFDGNHWFWDVLAFTAVIAMGLTGGLAAAVCAIRPAQEVREKGQQHQEAAGTLSFMAYICGQSSGLTAALVLKHVCQQHGLVLLSAAKPAAAAGVGGTLATMSHALSGLMLLY